MPAYLHQVIAVERGTVSDTAKRVREARRLLTVGGDQDPLTGISRRHFPKGDGDEKPEQARKVQMTVPDVIGSVQSALVKLFDLKLTREDANCHARADIEVDGTVLATGIPVGYLMFLESQLGDLIALIDDIPVLGLAEDWRDDAEGLPEGVYASAPRRTEVREREPQVQVLSPAQVIDGHKFDPQVRPYETEVVTGWWHQVKYSGQLPQRKVQEIRARAVKLADAVKFAREKANMLEVTDRKAGRQLLGFVFGDMAGVAS